MADIFLKMGYIILQNENGNLRALAKECEL